MKKLAVIFPGIGYHKDKPLLYYAAKLVQSMDYEVIHIEYSDMPKKIKGDAAKMQKAAEIAFSQTEEQLKDVRFSDYEDVLFIGKSIGTVALAKYISDHKIHSRQIWYTPVEATFLFGTNSDVIAFIGDADPWSDVEKVKETAKAQGIRMHSYPDCNHSLECENVLRNIDIIKDVMSISEDFINL